MIYFELIFSSAFLDLGRRSANIRRMFVVRLPKFRQAFGEHSANIRRTPAKMPLALCMGPPKQANI